MLKWLLTHQRNYHQVYRVVIKAVMSWVGLVVSLKAWCSVSSVVVNVVYVEQAPPQHTHTNSRHYMVAQGRIENYEKSGAELKRPRPRHTHTHTRRDLLEPPFPSLFSTSKKEQRVVCVCVCVRQGKNVDTIRSHHSAGVVFYWSNHSTHHKIDTSEQPIPTRTTNTTARLGSVKRERDASTRNTKISVNNENTQMKHNRWRDNARNGTLLRLYLFE